jgi:hypothetical protein
MRKKTLLLTLIVLTGVAASLFGGWDPLDIKGAFGNVRAAGDTDDGLIDGLYTCETSGVTEKETGILYPLFNWDKEKYPFYVSVNGRSNGTFRYFIGNLGSGVNRMFGTGTGKLSGNVLSGKSEFGFPFTMTFRFEGDTETGDYNVFADGTADTVFRLPKETGIPSGMGTVTLNCASVWNFDLAVLEEIEEDPGFDVAEFEEDPEPVEEFEDESGIVEEFGDEGIGDEGTDEEIADEEIGDDETDEGNTLTDDEAGDESGPEDEGTDEGSADSGSDEGGDDTRASI